MEPEMLIRREIISNEDLQKRFGIKRTKACQIMREIKSVSDILGIAGRVHEITKFGSARKKNGMRAQNVSMNSFLWH